MAKAKTKTPLAGHKKKLTAAVAMLLVSAIMVVSSTYAWFTLSTAPEVTGITTTVGANGNLEIALSPENGDAAGITSKVGDSMDATGQVLKSANVSCLRTIKKIFLRFRRVIPNAHAVNCSRTSRPPMKTTDISSLDSTTTFSMICRTIWSSYSIG